MRHLMSNDMPQERCLELWTDLNDAIVKDENLLAFIEQGVSQRSRPNPRGGPRQEGDGDSRSVCSLWTGFQPYAPPLHF